jgi:hypothetical protein
LTYQQFFTIAIQPVNDPPTLSPIPNLILQQHSVAQRISVHGISSGIGEDQPMSIEVGSDSSSMFSQLVANLNSDGTATLLITPALDQIGTAQLFVRIQDGGIDEDLSTLADNAIVSRSFTVQINSRPTATDDQAEVVRGKSVSIPVLANDSDLESPLSSLTIEIMQAPPASAGSISLGIGGSVQFTAASNFTGRTSFIYRVGDEHNGRSLPVQVDIAIAASSKQNPWNKFDVNRDTRVSPVDALIIINLLNDPEQGRSVDQYLGVHSVDVSGDGQISPIDALLVINQLNMRASEGEAEESTALTVTVPVSEFMADFYDHELESKVRKQPLLGFGTRDRCP